MYQPRHFRQDQPQHWQSLVAQFPLATLVTVTSDGLLANHVPLLWRDAPGGSLVGHVARANPLWQIADGQPALAIFQGPQGYVSPGWYPGKAEHGKVVPTWNYAVVHCHGRLQVHDDPDWLRALLQDLTDAHEGHRPQPWQVGEAPADYLAAQLRAIVGIELQIERVEAKFKLSQNKSAADLAGIQSGLTGAAASPSLADWMREAASEDG